MSEESIAVEVLLESGKSAQVDVPSRSPHFGALHEARRKMRWHQAQWFLASRAWDKAIYGCLEDEHSELGRVSDAWPE